MRAHGAAGAGGVNHAEDDILAAHEARHIGAVRLIIDFTRMARLLDHAVIHDDHLVGQRNGLGLRVRHMHEGDAEFGLQPLELAAHAQPQELIQRRQRLVEQQHLRIGDQRARQRHALLLPARKLGRHPIRQMRELHALQHVHRLLAALRRCPALRPSG